METKNKKNRRRLLIVLLVLLVGGCCAGGWLLLGDRLTGRGPAGPETSVTPVVQPADTPEGAEDPADPIELADPVTTEPEAPTPPADPGEPVAEPVTPVETTPAPVQPTPTPTPAPVPTPTPRPTPAPAPAPAPHTHKYADTRTEPTCTQPGQIVYTCSCGDVQSEIIAALGHDHSEAMYETRTHEVVVGYEIHTFCRGCGLDLTAMGLHGNDVTEHSKAHLLAGESSSTYQDTVEITETVTEEVIVGYKCSRCGDFKPMPQ